MFYLPFATLIMSFNLSYVPIVRVDGGDGKDRGVGVEGPTLDVFSLTCSFSFYIFISNSRFPYIACLCAFFLLLGHLSY